MSLTDHLAQLESAQLLRRLPDATFWPDALRLKGLALAGLGRTEEGRQLLAEARAEADRMGSRRSLLRILASLLTIADPVEAELLRQEARDIVQIMVKHIGSETLRTSFLATAEIRALFAAASDRP